MYIRMEKREGGVCPLIFIEVPLIYTTPEKDKEFDNSLREKGSCA